MLIEDRLDAGVDRNVMAAATSNPLITVATFDLPVSACGFIADPPSERRRTSKNGSQYRDTLTAMKATTVRNAVQRFAAYLFNTTGWPFSAPPTA